MRRLLASTPVVALAALALIAVVTWAILSNAHHRRVVIHDRTVVTTPIVSSPLTPLQARRAKQTSAAKSPDSRVSSSSPKNPTTTLPPRVLGNRPHRQSSTPTKRKATKTQPKRSSSPSSASQPAQTTPTQPSPQPGVTVPLPSAGVCLPPVHVGTCP